LQWSGFLYALYRIFGCAGCRIIIEGRGDCAWAGRNSIYYHNVLDALGTHYGFDINTPFNKLPEKIQKVLLYGSGNEISNFIMIVK